MGDVTKKKRRAERVILSMIAKAPEALVRRALLSAKPYVSEACVVVAPGDPLLKIKLPLPGRIVAAKWVGYAKTRNLAIELAEKQGTDWILMLDADDIFKAGGKMPALSSDVDAYRIPVFPFPSSLAPLTSTPRSAFSFPRPHLIRARAGWEFRGVVHEALYGKEKKEYKTVDWDGLVYLSGPANATRETFLEHARLLREELASPSSTFPPPTRSQFYLAQSLRDAGEHSEALMEYVKRGNMMGGVGEENMWAWLEAGELAWRLNFPWECVESFFKYAETWGPTRAEPNHRLAKLYRAWGKEERAREEEAKRVKKSKPEGAIFVDHSAYSLP